MPVKRIATLIALIFPLIFAAQNIKQNSYKIPKVGKSSPLLVKPSYNVEIKHLEAPFPNGKSYQSFINERKIESKSLFKTQKPSNNQIQVKSQFEPMIGSTFQPKRYLSNGYELLIYGGIPSDNTMAISNEGIALVAMNSTIYAHDIVQDTAVFPNYQIFLRDLANGGTSSSYFDPKLIYDPETDRFICAMLKDSDPNNSEVIICFSSSSNPNDDWYIYHLPGNPLNNNRWTDFPVITLSQDKLYFTANLIIPDVSWQVGFDGSIIWELDKFLGYNGADSLDAELYYDIKYENKYIRNLHAVQGYNGTMEDLILLSNRNFDITNDTIFFLHIQDQTLQIEALKSNLNYGVPPNARQQDTDTSDATMGLQTNDARILGAIRFEDEIQFVANTLNPSTGFSGIYHGIIENLVGNLTVRANIIGDSIKDLAYPNIAWSGNEACDRETIIAFDYSSFTDFPGMATVHFSNDEIYSNLKIVKESENYVDRLPGGYERWGDYFGLQRKYNEKGTVYAFGYIVMANKKNSGFCAALISRDSTELKIEVEPSLPFNTCENDLQLIITNGTPPYQISWTSSSGETALNTNFYSKACIGDTLFIEVVDSIGCSKQLQYIIPMNQLSDHIEVYPNPTDDQVQIQFTMQKDDEIAIIITDVSGKTVYKVDSKFVKKGLNELSLFLTPLSSGVYHINLLSSESLIGTYRVIKAN